MTTSTFIIAITTLALIIQSARLGIAQANIDSAKLEASREANEAALHAEAFKVAEQLNKDRAAQINHLEQVIERNKAKADVEKRLWIAENEKKIRADAVARSKAVSHGFGGENFAPLLSELPHKDFRHLGDPVDYLVCVGASDVRSGEGDEITEVLLLDIKTGKASLNKTQRRIRDAVAAGRCRFAVFNTDTREIRYWPEEQ